MANSREISERIKSIKDTRKITNAMFLIASSNLTRARENLDRAEPHFKASQRVIWHILHHVPDMEDRYFGNDERSAEKIGAPKRGYLVITGDKGLAGAYNHNVIKLVCEDVKRPGESVIFPCGLNGQHYFYKHNMPCDEEFQFSAYKPTIHRARAITDYILELYNNYELDEIYVVYTGVKGKLEAKAEIHQLLPINKSEFFEVSSPEKKYDTLFLPSPRAVMNTIIPNYLTGYIFGAMVEAFYTEQNARMTAMQSATKSADEMLAELSVSYNRARQAEITQEMTEVTGGVRANKISGQEGRR